MRVTELGRGLYGVGVEEQRLRVYRSESFTERGLCYSSYAIKTSEGVITLGSLPERYAEEWADSLAKLAGENGVKWSVFFGVEGDAPACRAITARFPDATIVGGENVLHNLTAAIGKLYHTLLVRTARTLLFGEKELEFHVITDHHEVPSLYVIDRENAALINADAFGSDCAPGADRVSALPDPTEYLKGAELYFADIYGKRRHKAMEKAVGLVRQQEIRLICPAFGPAVDQDIDKLLEIYERPWRKKNSRTTLAIAYLPEQGVGTLAKAIADGASERKELSVDTIDLSAVSAHEALDRLEAADGILFGVPMRLGDEAKAVWDMLMSLKRDCCKGKFAAVFHTNGIDSLIPSDLRARFEMLGFNMNARDFFSTGMPSESELNAAREYGFGMACLMLGVPNPHKPTLVKCLICGEIFDASLGTCPVCGVGLDQCVPVDEDEVLFRRDSDRRYVIIGGGVAALSAAEAIRQRDQTGSILMLSAENYLPINRPMLTKNLDELKEDPDALLVHPREWYEERAIDLRLGVTVASIRTEQKTVLTDSGEEIGYDKLIYAAGAECFLPPFTGHEKKGVLTLRHLWDTEALNECMCEAKKAVVIGGGVIGLEAASEIMRHGIQVTVLEASPQIIGRQADAASAASLKRIMEKMGVACYEGVSIAEITGDERAQGVKLADGREFPGDFVIVSCGIRANINLAKDAGLQVNRSIVVNVHMETSVKDIYACGDCAELDGVNFQLWQEATKQGKAAGANAAGDNIICTNDLLGLSLEGFGSSFYAIGDPGKREGVPYQTVELTDGVRNRIEKYWYVGERLEGCILIGAHDKVAEVSQAVAGRYRYTDMNG